MFETVIFCPLGTSKDFWVFMVFCPLGHRKVLFWFIVIIATFALWVLKPFWLKTFVLRKALAKRVIVYLTKITELQIILRFLNIRVKLLKFKNHRVTSTGCDCCTWWRTWAEKVFVFSLILL